MRDQKFKRLIAGMALFFFLSGCASQSTKSLILACKNNDFQSAENALCQGADIDYSFMEDGSPLYYALLTKNLTLIELLLKYGAKTDFTLNNELNLLQFVLSSPLFNNDEKNNLAQLMIQYKANFNKIESGFTPLYYAVKNNLTPTAKLLLEKKEISLNIYPPKEQTASNKMGGLDISLIKAEKENSLLFFAIQNDNEEIVRLLLKNPDIDYSYKDYEKSSIGKRFHILELLMKQAANKDDSHFNKYLSLLIYNTPHLYTYSPRTNQYNSILEWAAANTQLNLIKIILNKNQLDNYYKNYSPLYYALKSKNMKVLQFVLNLGVSPTQSCSETDNLHPLLFAVLINFPDGVKELLSRNSNYKMNTAVLKNLNIAEVAYLKKHSEISDFLTKKGAVINKEKVNMYIEQEKKALEMSKGAKAAIGISASILLLMGAILSSK